jgi:hypothetical protein
MIGQIDQAFPWFSLVPEQMLSWYPNSTLHCMLLMQPSKYLLFKIFRHNIALPKSDYISPTTSAPTSLKIKIEQITNTSLAFTGRTSGHCLGTFETAKVYCDYTPPSNTVLSLTNLLPTNFLFPLSLSLSV